MVDAAIGTGHCGSDGRGARVIAFARRVGWHEPKSSKHPILVMRESRALEVTRHAAPTVDAVELHLRALYAPERPISVLARLLGPRTAS
jgi:hypothetical protein